MRGSAAWWLAWQTPGAAAVPLVLALTVYVIGWRRLRRQDAKRWSGFRLCSFIVGLGVMAIAIWSPIDVMGQWLLSAHMSQHLLLAMVAPPLVLLGNPFSPLLAGVPRWMSKDFFGPILGWPFFQHVAQRLVHPAVAGPLFIVMSWGWHLPFAYEWALTSDAAHAFEHACFFWTGVCFWWPVVQPWPWKSIVPRWVIVPYLLAADVANTLLAAIFAFAPGVVYATYRDTSPALGVDALQDQQVAAAIMWLPGSLIYLIPAVVILVQALSPKRLTKTISLPLLQQPRARKRWNVVRVPLLGAVLQNATARNSIRWCMFLLAALVVADGFLGPNEAATNLAGTWPWTHWRGVAAVSLVLAGNVACLGCPLIAPRNLLRQWIRPKNRWPNWLRGKWVVAAILVIWLMAYEAFGWWNSPVMTAWLLVGLVAAATVVDLIFQGSSFCQWLCPIGQWNMSMSMASPIQVGVLDPDICTRCTTHDCLRGGPKGPGCGTNIFLPRKVGSLDCTACMDCVTACPHDNAGAGLVVPFHEIAPETVRSSIGKWIERTDLVALLLVLECGAIVNAILMTAPVANELDTVLPSWPRAAVVALVTLLGMVLCATPIGVAAAIGGWQRCEPVKQRLARLVMDLWPIGASLWLVHFGFHLVTGWKSALPPLQRAAMESEWVDLGEPAWAANCCATSPDWLVPVMLCALGGALCISLQLLWNRAANASATTLLRQVVRWCVDAIVAILWWSVSVWIVLQPMQMRGLLP